MNEEICCITNEGKMARNEWENDDSNFLQALYSVYKKVRIIFFHTLLAVHCSVANNKYFKKLINKWSIKNIGLRFFKNNMYRVIPLIKL